ncbi:MAG: alanyl-tRNA synthetase [Maribacter sp.]
MTNDAVKEYFFDSNQSLEDIKEVLGNAQDPIKAVSSLQQENAELKKQVAQLLKEKAKNLKEDLTQELQEVNGVQFLAKQIDLDAAGIKDLSFEMGQNQNNLFLLFGTEQNGKALLSCYISKELVISKNLNAGTIVRELGKHIQGSGGGQPFFATAGGKNSAGIGEALEQAKAYL